VAAALLAFGAEQSGSPPAQLSLGKGRADLLLWGSGAADPALVQQISNRRGEARSSGGAARGHQIRWWCGAGMPDLVVHGAQRRWQGLRGAGGLTGGLRNGLAYGRSFFIF